MINRNSPVPLYFQLMQQIKEQIESGQLVPGDAVPTEVELMEQYDVSRATVRQSLLQLVNEGYVRRIKAKGTFVNTRPEKPKFIGTLKGFAQEMRQKGIPFSTEVLEKRIVPSSLKVSEKLRITAGSPVFHLCRLRCIHHEPVLIAHSYLPEQLCRGIEGIDFEKNSLYDILEQRYGIILHHGRRDFEPAIPSAAEDVKLLGISSRTPILYVESVVCTQDDTPVEYVVIKMRGRFTVDLLQTFSMKQ
jgi:GntR family transcriptional regulator